MASEIDILRCSVGVAALRDAGCGVVRPVRVVLGSQFRMTLPAVRGASGRLGAREWGMSIRGSRV
jgi:hypothetical protein